MSGLTRRDFLKKAGAGGAAAIGGGLFVRPSTWKRSLDAPVHLTFWDMDSGIPYQKVGAQIVAQFNSSHPNIHVDYIPTEWANVNQKFASSIASGTNPNVSSGLEYQAFQYYQQGSAMSADQVFADLKKSGALSAYEPGLANWARYKGHYVGVPWTIDVRIPYYRKSLLDKAGVAPPKKWSDILAAGQALKKMGVFGFGFAGGTTSGYGWQTTVAMLINNGGGLFDKEGNLHCTSDANVQTIEFLQQLARDKIIDPAAPGYTSTETTKQFASGQLAFFFSDVDFPANGSLPQDALSDTFVLEDPLVSPRGKKGTISFINSLTIYKHQNGGSGAANATAEFVAWYVANMTPYWSQNVFYSMPAQKPMANLKIVKDNPYISVPTAKWLPVAGHTTSAYQHPTADGNTIQNAPSMYNFAEAIVNEASTPAKTLLSNLESQLRTEMGKSRLS